MKDRATGDNVMIASVVSSNRRYLNGTLDDDVRATLTIMKTADENTHVYVTIGAGQLPCRSESLCRVMVRAEEDAPLVLDASVPVDGNSRQLYVKDASRLVALVRRAGSIALTVPDVQGGDRSWTFDTSHLSI